MYALQSPAEVLQSFHARQQGLNDAEVAERKLQYGANTFPQKQKSIIILFLSQFKDVLVLMLVGALVLSLGLHYLTDSGEEAGIWEILSILAILLLNAVLGTVQEYRSEQALKHLSALSAPQSRVRRSGMQMLIPSADLVPGDILLIEAGDRVAADGRILSASHLQMNESSLTGESALVEKKSDAIHGQRPSLQDQCNMVFGGTLVARGSAEVLVTAIGLQSEVGKIAAMVASTETPATPLEMKMRSLSKIIGIGVLLLCLALATIMLLKGEVLLSVVLLCVSLAVSAVPEGLPAVVTACLAMGVQRMAAKAAIVRRLDALETLGSITVICSDKTGTITENRMRVVSVWLPQGATQEDESLLLQIAASCNRAELPGLGDPTEVGLLQYAMEQGITRLEINEEEVPFTSESKYMRTKHGEQSFVKGAPEVVLKLSDHARMEEIESEVRRLSADGLRVLAMAVGEGKRTRFVGLMAMEDPPRAEVEKALLQAKKAGIRTVMITGDNIDTAMSIASRIGIHGSGVGGAELDTLTADQLQQLVRTAGVYGRVSPEHKIKILRALQENGEIVAMTGDGVNDAPALQAAHVGIAMGKDGTQVAREAASLVLANDNYATIVEAIREGRHLYDNIRKFVLYLLRANLGQVMLFTVAVIIGLPLPLLPIHILWINLMTDGLPALALGMEPEEVGIMQRKPRPITASLFEGQWMQVLASALCGCGVVLFVFLWALARADVVEARTLAFTASILFELLLALSSRSPRPLWKVGLLGNRWLLVAVSIPLVLQLLLLFTPLHDIFSLHIPSHHSFILSIGVVLCGWVIVEFSKWMRWLAVKDGR